MVCPEIEIKLNKINIKALVGTGCNISCLQEQWYNLNKLLLEPQEIFPVTNLNIITATGKKSKRIQ